MNFDGAGTEHQKKEDSTRLNMNLRTANTLVTWAADNQKNTD